MRQLYSLIMRAGEKSRFPAVSAMAVDRYVFSAEVQTALEQHPKVTIMRERIDRLPEAGLTIVATGPLTAQALAESVVAATGQERLAFFDAIAPIVHRDSIDMDVCWIQSRWDKKRSEEHTSELQSQMSISNALFGLKKKTNIIIAISNYYRYSHIIRT